MGITVVVEVQSFVRIVGAPATEDLEYMVLVQDLEAVKICYLAACCDSGTWVGEVDVR